MKKLLSLAATALVAMSANAAISDTDFANNDYIGEWGRLKVQGTHIVSEKGEQIQLKGWSSFGWQNNWGDCHSEGAIKQMKIWGANIYRGAMYVTEGGYNNDKSGFTQITKDLIDLTAKYKMYYLCDWHILDPGDPLSDSYRDFSNYFREITSYVKSKGYHHVLYEICNEPNSDKSTNGVNVDWNRIRQYADQVLPIIQSGDPGAVVVVGTPRYDQEIDQAKNNPITGYPNLGIMYSFHYYSCSHQNLLGKYDGAVNVIPVFISEWGVAKFDGGSGYHWTDEVGDDCKSGAKQLMNKAFENKTPWCCWSFGMKEEMASAVMDCGKLTLSKSGQFVVESFMGGCSTCKPEITACYEGSCQKVPGVIDLGKYDENPEGEATKKNGLTVVGAGEGVAYHEENTVTDEEENDGSLCNAAFKYGGEGFNFRPDECVDASNCYGITNSEGWHNLGVIEPLEWETYTIDIEEPGYYEIEGLLNPTTHQQMSIDSKTYKENLLYNYETEEQLPSISFSTNQEDQGNSNNWKFWAWEKPVNNLDDADEIKAALLFKEAGQQTIRILWGEGTEAINAYGDFGPIRLTYVKAYTGPGYENVKTVDAPANEVIIYPSPATDVVYATGDVAKISICNIAGCIVAEAAENSVNIAALASGTYIAKVTLSNGAVVTKTIIKK